MKKLTTALLCLAALVALPATASAAKPVKYVGKTSDGQKVTFTLVGQHARNYVTGLTTHCLPIQGVGTPTVGAETWVHSFDINRTQEWQAKVKPAYYYNEVTANFSVTSKKFRNGTIKGKMRWQYQFLIPKYPIGTFTIYGCLGVGTFTAKPVR